MRSSKPSLWNLTSNLFTSGPVFLKRTYFIISVLLAVVTLALQFTSTILLSDVRIVALPVVSMPITYSYDLDPGLNHSDVLATVQGWPIYSTTQRMRDRQLDLIEHFRVPWWVGYPSQFPIFGEYHEEISSLPADVDDTGYLLRAFLPFSTAEEREAISAFSGPTFFLDSRVSCQPPNVTDAKLQVTNVTVVNRNFLPGYVSGNATGTLDAEGLWFPPNISRTVPFNCSFLLDFELLPGMTPNRRVSICQHQPVDNFQTRMLLRDDNDPAKRIRMGTEAAGSLRSRLQNLTADDVLPAQSPAYLLVSNGDTVPRDQRKGWATLSLTPQVNNLDPNATRKAPSEPQEILVSLCYTSWRGNAGRAELRTGKKMREPKPRTRPEGRAGLLFDEVLSQLYAGPDSDEIPEFARPASGPQPSADKAKPGRRPRPGVMAMGNFSVAANADLAYPLQQSTFVQLIASVGGESLIDFTTNGFSQVIHEDAPGANLSISAPNLGTTFYDWAPYYAFYAGVVQDHYIAQDMPGQDYLIWTDPSINDFLVQAVTAYGGSGAWTLSAALTLLSQTAYYDHFQMFDRSTKSLNAETDAAHATNFVNVEAPQSWAGLLTVSGLLVVELAIAAAITALFLARTRYSRLGNAWQAVAQVSGPDTEEVLRHGTLATDSEIEKWLGSRQKAPVRIGVVRDDDDEVGRDGYGTSKHCVDVVEVEEAGAHGMPRQQTGRSGLEGSAALSPMATSGTMRKRSTIKLARSMTERSALGRVVAVSDPPLTLTTSAPSDAHTRRPTSTGSGHQQHEESGENDDGHNEKTAGLKRRIQLGRPRPRTRPSRTETANSDSAA